MSRGDLLFEIDARPFQAEVDRLRAELDRARATIQRAGSELQRAERLAAENAISAAALESILGKGQAKDGMFKFVVGRKTKMPCGCEATKEMGVNTWAAFAGTDDNAVVDGDFAVLEDELQPVLRSLRTAGVNIVAIHHHMTQTQPTIFFLHYWGTGAAEQLATGFKAALAELGRSPSGRSKQ